MGWGVCIPRSRRGTHHPLPLLEVAHLSATEPQRTPAEGAQEEENTKTTKAPFGPYSEPSTPEG